MTAPDSNGMEPLCDASKFCRVDYYGNKVLDLDALLKTSEGVKRFMWLIENAVLARMPSR